MLIFCQGPAHTRSMPQVKTAAMTPKEPRRKESFPIRPPKRQCEKERLKRQKKSHRKLHLQSQRSSNDANAELR